MLISFSHLFCAHGSQIRNRLRRNLGSAELLLLLCWAVSQRFLFGPECCRVRPSARPTPHQQDAGSRARQSRHVNSFPVTIALSPDGRYAACFMRYGAQNQFDAASRISVFNFTTRQACRLSRCAPSAKTPTKVTLSAWLSAPTEPSIRFARLHYRCHRRQSRETPATPSRFTALRTARSMRERRIKIRPAEAWPPESGSRMDSLRLRKEPRSHIRPDSRSSPVKERAAADRQQSFRQRHPDRRRDRRDSYSSSI